MMIFLQKTCSTHGLKGVNYGMQEQIFSVLTVVVTQLLIKIDSNSRIELHKD